MATQYASLVEDSTTDFESDPQGADPCFDFDSVPGGLTIYY